VETARPHVRAGNIQDIMSQREKTDETLRRGAELLPGWCGNSPTIVSIASSWRFRGHTLRIGQQGK
jgi:hypothetical protein